MFDAAVAHAPQAFAFHPETHQVIVVTDGQRGYAPVRTRLSPQELNHIFRTDLLPSRIEAMLDYALDQPALTDIDVSQGWPA